MDMYCVSCDYKLEAEDKTNTCKYCNEIMQKSFISFRITEKDLREVKIPKYYSDI